MAVSTALDGGDPFTAQAAKPDTRPTARTAAIRLRKHAQARENIPAARRQDRMMSARFQNGARVLRRWLAHARLGAPGMCRCYLNGLIQPTQCCNCQCNAVKQLFTEK